jgi:sugar phosphate isomerase/epimerase
MRHDQIALQLYTVRRLAADDLPGTLRAVAAAGYRFVELAGLPETAPGELARLLDETRLRPVASHEGIARLRDDPAAVAQRLGALGCPAMIVPWMPEEDRRTTADVRRFAAELGTLARIAGDHGLRLGYHNHAFEFEPLGGTTTWDILAAELPDSVEIELDVYWVSAAGRDPVTEIRSVADRLHMLHVKDRAPGLEPHDAPVGDGILDIPGIVRAGDDAGVAWFVVEQDDAADPLADAATSARYLASLAG